MTDLSPRAYDTYSERYEDAYPDAVVDLHPAGRTGAVLMRAQQDAGDWPGAATPDLIIIRPTTYDIEATLDFGAGRFRTNCPRNSFAVTPPATPTSGRVEGPFSFEAFGVAYKSLLSLAGEDARLPGNGDFGLMHSNLHEDSEIGFLLDRLFKEVDSGSPRGALYADSIILHLTARLLEIRDGIGTEPAAAAHGGLAPWQVKRVCEAMIAAMDAGEAEASLAELALMVGLSANHFCRGFAQSVGLPPHRWMTERRMERAALLFLDTTMSLTEIALALGYTSQSAFGRAFVRVTGVTPSVRRRELLS